MRQPAETRCADELLALRAHDRWERPPGWQLSPRLVETFILGSREPLGGADGQPLLISPKFVGARRLVQVAIATLASDRALMLTGEPGVAKSWLSEHLAAAISGTSQLVVQGTAGTTEEQIKYSWNYALLIAEEAVAPGETAQIKQHQLGSIVQLDAKPIPSHLVLGQLVREPFVIHPGGAADFVPRAIEPNFAHHF